MRKPEDSEEDDKYEFIEAKLFDTYLCPADFKNGLLNKEFGSIGSYV
jgi:hypothetical protein